MPISNKGFKYVLDMLDDDFLSVNIKSLRNILENVELVKHLLLLFLLLIGFPKWIKPIDPLKILQSQILAALKVISPELHNSLLQIKN